MITKIKAWDARIFYIQSAAANFWSLTVLEHHIENNLYGKEGKLPNNFSGRLSEGVRPSALKVFKDEYFNLCRFTLMYVILNERTVIFC